MATTKEIKNRIKSVKDTQKITNAMYLISSAKMRKAKKEMEATKPYFELLKKEINRIFSVHEDVTGKYFSKGELEEKDDECIGILVITADKGLAGAYNQNVIKEALGAIKRASRYKLYVVGEYGRHYFMAHGYVIEQSFLYTAQNPSLDRAREIMDILLTEFNEGSISRMYICYTDFKNSFTGGSAVGMRLLPFDKDEIAYSKEENEAHFTSSFEFEPSLEIVLDSIVPSYLAGFVYSALVESFCSEQSARMTAMDAANDNAEELLDVLSKEYNHVRQGAITREITEISAGARGQKISAEKRKKKKLEKKKENEAI